MQESKLLGTLLPSSPDFLPIVRQMREKYGLPEIDRDDDPITELSPCSRASPSRLAARDPQGRIMNPLSPQS